MDWDRSRSWFLAATAAVAAGSLAACLGRPAGPQVATPAPCAAPEYRRLDFWVGDWDAYDVGGSARPVARVRVEVILGGCALHEIYEGANGLAGESYTTYDAPRNLWHQTWMTNRATLLAIEGRFEGESLTLQGRQVAVDGHEETVRGVWRPQGDGVREIAHTSVDGGATWRPWFDILFQRRK